MDNNRAIDRKTISYLNLIAQVEYTKDRGKSMESATGRSDASIRGKLDRCAEMIQMQARFLLDTPEDIIQDKALEIDRITDLAGQMRRMLVNE